MSEETKTFAQQQVEKYDRQCLRDLRAGRITRHAILPEQWRRIKK